MTGCDRNSISTYLLTSDLSRSWKLRQVPEPLMLFLAALKQNFPWISSSITVGQIFFKSQNLKETEMKGIEVPQTRPRNSLVWRKILLFWGVLLLQHQIESATHPLSEPQTKIKVKKRTVDDFLLLGFKALSQVLPNIKKSVLGGMCGQALH